LFHLVAATFLSAWLAVAGPTAAPAPDVAGGDGVACFFAGGHDAEFACLARPYCVDQEVATGILLASVSVSANRLELTLVELATGARAALAVSVAGPDAAPEVAVGSGPSPDTALGRAVDAVTERLRANLTPERLRALLVCPAGREKPPEPTSVAGIRQAVVAHPYDPLFYLLVALALGVLVFELRGARFRRSPGVPRDLLIGLGLTAASLVVRLVLTSVQDVTDGVTLWHRDIEVSPDFGAIGILVRLLLPSSHEANPVAVLTTLAILSALTPAAVFGLGRALGLRRLGAALAGAMVAAWPLHAALYSGGFDQGAIVAVAVVALALVAAGTSRDDLRYVPSGVALLAFVVWCRPEALLHVGMAALLLFPARRRLLHHRLVVGALAVLAASVAGRVVFLASSGLLGATLGAGTPLFSVQTFSKAVEYFGTHGDAVVPLEVPLGLLLFLVHGAPHRRIVLAGILLGLSPYAVYGCGPFEWFRYGSHALPWLALGAGAGFAGALLRLKQWRPHLPGRWISGPRVAVGLAALLGLELAARPVVHAPYLARVYDQTVTDAFLRHALERVPEGCALGVPTTLADAGINSWQRYFHVAVDAVGLARARSSVVPSVALVRGLERAGEPLASEELEAFERRFAVPPLGQATCWYFLWSWECTNPRPPGPPMTDPGFCGAIRARARLEPIYEERVDLVDHRLVAEPAAGVDDPRRRRDVPLVLYRVVPRFDVR